MTIEPEPPPGPAASPATGSGTGGNWLSPGVGGIGAASLFSDAGHEITTAVLPSFLTSTRHASATH